MSFAKEVWQTLSAVDVTPYVEKKGGLSYISWANCYGLVKREYPETHFPTFDYFEIGETGMVRCRVTVAEGEKEVTQEMSLPVMDYKNKSIVTPTTRDINDSNMRCFAKCCAVHGLGIDLFQGELNVPEVQPEPVPENWATDEQMAKIQEYAEADAIPAPTVEWLEGRKYKLTQNQATTLLAKLREQGK